MKTTLVNYIEIEGDFDTYTIYQTDEEGIEGRFITESKCGYSNYDNDGHRSLLEAIKHVHAMIKTEYLDRCLEQPK